MQKKQVSVFCSQTPWTRLWNKLTTSLNPPLSSYVTWPDHRSTIVFAIGDRIDSGSFDEFRILIYHFLLFERLMEWLKQTKFEEFRDNLEVILFPKTLVLIPIICVGMGITLVEDLSLCNGIRVPGRGSLPVQYGYAVRFKMHFQPLWFQRVSSITENYSKVPENNWDKSCLLMKKL